MVVSKRPRRQLKSGWTIEHQPSIFEVDDDLTSGIAKRIQEEIDAEILWKMLKREGWIEVEVSYYTDNNHAVDITYWVESNVRHQYKRSWRRFLFESEQDANWFKIRWL